MAARDQQRVLAVEPHPAPRGRGAVDVLVRVDEDAVRPAEPLAELGELPAELGVGVVPGVAREPALRPALDGRLGLPVAERGRDDAPRAGHERLGMARDLRLRHGELHLGEQAARAALADRPLRVVVGLGAGDADRVQAQLLAQPANVFARHARIVP